MLQVTCFRFWGRLGHFRRAESAVSALTYPFPPRTALIGLIGAILGLPKDQAQEILEPLYVAVAGKYPLVHWHKAKLRKDPPAMLNWSIKSSQTLERNTAPEKVALVSQEWLFNPEYIIWVSLPDAYHKTFTERVKERRWYFQPCLGVSEMMAQMEYLEDMSGLAEPLPLGDYEIESVVNQEKVHIDTDKIFEKQLALNLLKMPRRVNGDRVFTHASYVMEQEGLAIPVKTENAYGVGSKVIMFL